MINWSEAYEAPISLDSSRLIGTRARRPTLWILAGCVVIFPIVIAFIVVQFPAIQIQLLDWVPKVVLALLPVSVLWGLVCYTFATDWGQRSAEYWLWAWFRHIRLHRQFDAAKLIRHHADLHVHEHALEGNDFPRGVIEVEPLNLKMNDADTLGSHIKKLHAFYLGLKYPIQIVVRAWAQNDSVERRWFIAISADTLPVLDDRLRDILAGLARAGLSGRTLNGDLFDSLQACWSPVRNGRLGPSVIQRTRNHVQVDGEYVRGLLLTRMPRTIDPNWMASILDGELPVDCSIWLDPIDNADEFDMLSMRINEWETAQVLNVTRSGYRDPDIEDQIKDAQRTRLFLRRRMLRVFRGSIGFVVRGNNLATMLRRERLLVDQLREQVGDNAVVPIDYEHDRAPLLAVPTGVPPITYLLQVVSPAAALSYPFSNSSVSMKEGVECGTSLGSNRLNRLNLFGLDNPHMIIPGTTGAGKGYWIKVYLWRLLHAYAWEKTLQVTIIQSEKDEYTALADALGSDKLGSRSQIVHVTELDQLDSLRYSHSGALRAFRDLVVYDLTKMKASERGKAIASILEGIEYAAAHRRRMRHGIVVIDELGIVLRDHDASMAIETAYRRFRSIPWASDPREVNRVAVIGLTQLPSDLLGHPNGKVYAALAETHLYLRQKPTELRVTKGVLNLSPDEVNFLETAGNGDALLVAGRARVALHLHATKEEHELACT